MKRAARIICFAHNERSRGGGDYGADCGGDYCKDYGDERGADYKEGFESGDTSGFMFDGFAVLKDPVREDV